MGTWEKDQSKHRRRYDWRLTQGENDPVRRDIAGRLKPFPELAALRTEKIGPEIHFWRLSKDPAGRPFWASCLRLVGDGFGSWDVFWRPDEGRWRSTGIKDLSTRLALEAVATFYREKSHDFL